MTVAQASWQDLGKDVYQQADRIPLMAYDHAFPKTTYDKAAGDVERLISFGCPPQKIALGVPLYGRNRNGSARTYSELVASSSTTNSSDLIRIRLQQSGQTHLKSEQLEQV